MSRLARLALVSSLLLVGCKNKEAPQPAPPPAAPTPAKPEVDSAIGVPWEAPPGDEAMTAMKGVLADLGADQLKGSGCREIEGEQGWATLGPRTVGCMLLGQLGWPRFLELGGRFPFASGPHNPQDGLRFDAVDGFGHYDPEVAALGARAVGALAEATPAGSAVRQGFATYVQPMARTLFLAELEFQRDPTRFRHELAVYQEEIAARRSYSPGDRLGDYLARSPLQPLVRSGQGGSDSLAIGPAVAFWLRREMDGTRATFAGGLERVLRAWDTAFVDEAKALVKPVRPSQAAWSEGQVFHLVGRAWETLDAIQLEVGDPGEGTRGAWRWLYPAAEWLWTGAAAGIPPFLSGQENGTMLDLRKPHAFGRYDPRFVAWLRQQALRNFGGEGSRERAQATYDRHLAALARSFWVAWVAYREDPAARDRDLEAFKAGVGDKTLPVDWYRGLETPVGSTAPARAARAGHRAPPKIGPEAQAFWLRRLVDGTASEFAAGLETLLTEFDAKFLAAMKAPPADAGVPTATAEPTGPAPAPVAPAPAPRTP